MEINKILFEQLSQTKGINNPFEDFDVNNDGVINEKDAAAAVQNEALASQITNLLSSVDEDVELDDNAEFFENELQNISISKSGSSKTSEANAAANLIYESQIAENYGKHDIDDLLAAIPENLYYGFSGNFTTSYRSILSDPLFFLRITNDDIKKLSDTISSLNEKNTSGSKLYASALQNLLDSIEAQKSSYNSLQDELNGSSLASGKTIEINVFGGSVQSTNSSSVTVTNVNGSNVYNVKNGSDNVYFTDEDIDNLLNAINSTKTSKSYMEYIITGTLSQSSSLGEGGYIDETTWMKSNMKKLAESILGMKCTYQASSSKGESKFEWTNSLGQTSTFGSCMQCAASTGNFVNLLYKAVQARTILKNAQNSSTSELDGVTSPLKSGGNNADSSQVSNATASNSSTSVIALTQFEINNLNSKQEEIQEKIEEKEKELETIQKKIQNKQEELEALVKEAQNNNDSSKAELISDLQVEIKSLSENASTLIDEIKSLQSEYNANAIRLTSMSATAQSQQANAVAQANAVEGVNSVNATNEVTNPIGSTSTASTQSTKFERKTLSEYITEIDSKLESVWTQFGGDAQKVQQYIKNNLNDFADVDGDGVLTPVDNLIISKWQNKHSTNREDYESSEKRNALIGTAENSVYKVMFRATQRCSESYMMNLEDLEFYFQNGGTCGCAFLGKVTFGYWGKTDGYNQYGNSSNIDYTKIAQSEDWEQRLDNLFSIVPGLKHTSEKIKDYVSKISDFVKANPQNATYASAAVTYQLRLEEYNKKKEEAEKIDWDQKAQEKLDELNEKYQEALKTSKSEYKDYLKYTCNNKKEYAASYETYCKLNVYNGGFDGDTKDINSLLDSSNLVKSVSQVAQNLKSQYLGTPPEEWSYTKSLDINSDGKVNADDLANFCTEIDLDGDGTVSDAERSYLNNTKKKLDNKVYKNMKNTGMYNQNSIDDVISYYSNVDVQAKYDRMNEMYEQLKQELQAHIDRSNAIWDRNEKIEDVALLGMRRAIPLTSYILGGVPTLPCSGYLDGTCGDKDYIDKLCFGNINVVLDAWKKGMEMTEPSNMYLHYVQSADLSKEELQSILNKINSASSEIQEKLSEVKNAVEQRLKSM